MCADVHVLHSSRGEEEWEDGHASGSGFFVHLRNVFTPPNTTTILTTTSWLMPLWERVGDVQQGCLQTWIKENVRFSVIVQFDNSNCTRPQPASLVACFLLKSVYRTLQTAFPHSEFFDYSPASSSLPRKPSQTARFTECLSSLLLLQLGPLSWTAREGRGGPAL